MGAKRTRTRSTSKPSLSRPARAASARLSNCRVGGPGRSTPSAHLLAQSDVERSLRSPSSVFRTSGRAPPAARAPWHERRPPGRPDRQRLPALRIARHTILTRHHARNVRGWEASVRSTTRRPSLERRIFRRPRSKPDGVAAARTSPPRPTNPPTTVVIQVVPAGHLDQASHHFRPQRVLGRGARSGDATERVGHQPKYLRRRVRRR